VGVEAREEDGEFYDKGQEWSYDCYRPKGTTPQQLLSKEIIR